jgi:histone acetyltransferase (RNA polymerase elongator complex component)
MINRKAFKALDGQFSYNFETDSYDNNGVEVVNRVYATDKNNVRLFEIGRDIIRNDVLYDKEKGKFVDLQGNVKRHQKRFRRINESKVSEYVEFVCKNEIIENGEKHILYNINKKALSKVFTVSNPENPDIEINKYISVLLGNIYKSQSHSGVQIQTTLTRKSAILLKQTLNGLAEELKYDTNLKEFINITQSLLKGAT